MIRIVIKGQIMGGKNNIVITRTGMRFPKKSWAAWRDQAVMQVRTQLPKGFKAFDENVTVGFCYVAGDKRRRDMPAIIDSVWHVLEKAGVVTDDELLWVSVSNRTYDRANPGVWLALQTEAKEGRGKPQVFGTPE